jgi:hypothetical protein
VKELSQKCVLPYLLRHRRGWSTENDFVLNLTMNISEPGELIKRRINFAKMSKLRKGIIKRENGHPGPSNWRRVKEDG